MRNILKKRRVKKTIELKALGFLIPTSRISSTLNPKLGHIGELSRCTFDGECDFCKKPKKGSYVLMSCGSDYEETEYYVCGKCATKRHYKGSIEEIKHWLGWAEYAQNLQAGTE